MNVLSVRVDVRGILAPAVLDSVVDGVKVTLLVGVSVVLLCLVYL